MTTTPASQPAAPLALVGFDNDDPRQAEAKPLNTSSACHPPLSGLLPMSKAIRNPEEAVTRAEADFATQQMIILIDFLDARYETGVIPNRDDMSEAGRERALQAISGVISLTNRPYFEERFKPSAAAKVLQAAGGVDPAPADKTMRQRDLDETFRRVLIYALAVVNSAKAI